VSEYFGAYPDDDLPDGLYNVPPTETIRMIVNRDGERRLAAARWGFQPFWTENAAAGTPRSWINARAETAAASPAFGPAIRSTRCVIPADLFYEWDRTVRPRQPFAIGPASDGEMLALAGIWSRSRAFGVTAAILTTRPNELVAPIHNRMPVILPQSAWATWLDPENDDIETLSGLLIQAPDTLLEVHAVSSDVNNVRNKGASLIEPVTRGETES
jgi:putative SOS response-associated peptidase YedK